MSEPVSRSELEQAFGLAMRSIYTRAKLEAGYNATYFLQMLAEIGPLATARRLVMSSQPSEGFTALWERHRLDLTVEAHVLLAEFEPLFSDEERSASRLRLDEYGYTST